MNAAMRGSLLAAVAALGGVPGIIALLSAAAVFMMSAGYIFWLRTHQRKSAAETPRLSSAPAVDIIVAVHNEADQIAGKLANIRELQYPQDRLRLWVVDGLSSDDTRQIIARTTRDDARFELLQERPDKTAQLNAALARGTAPWVLITDADARLPPQTLAALVSAAEADSRLGAVGTAVEPAESCHWLERAHWRVSNRIRSLESRTGCASIMTGPCYLVRREVIGRIPEDVVADDIHVALAAARLDFHVVLVDVPVAELRAPRSLPELFRHKLRKTIAYLREIYRFLPEFRKIPRPARALFAWRAAQLVVLPWAAVMALVCLILSSSPLLAGALVVSGLGGGAIWLVGSVVRGRDRKFALTGLPLSVFLLAVCLTAALTYPFRPRSACYPKVGTKRA